MSDLPSQFSWYDALVLYALLNAGPEGTNLAGIASFHDYVDHSRPSDEELRSRLQRLEAAGHVLASGPRYRASANVWTECRAGILGPGSAGDAVEFVHQFLEGA